MPGQYAIVRTDLEKIASLTAREAAILVLVSDGLSNLVTAVQLGISERTVGKHLEHIYAKLDVTNRTAAAAVWHRGRHR